MTEIIGLQDDQPSAPPYIDTGALKYLGDLIQGDGKTPKPGSLIVAFSLDRWHRQAQERVDATLRAAQARLFTTQLRGVLGRIELDQDWNIEFLDGDTVTIGPVSARVSLLAGMEGELLPLSQISVEYREICGRLLIAEGGLDLEPAARNYRAAPSEADPRRPAAMELLRQRHDYLPAEIRSLSSLEVMSGVMVADEVAKRIIESIGLLPMPEWPALQTFHADRLSILNHGHGRASIFFQGAKQDRSEASIRRGNGSVSNRDKRTGTVKGP